MVALCIVIYVIAIIIPLISCGYLTNSLQRLLDAIHTIYGPSIESFHNLDLLEFGSQEIHDLKYEDHQVFKQYKYAPKTYQMKPFFEHIGFNYISIDINGYHNALPLDVRFNLTMNVTNRFDIITNVGFSEHVGESDIEDNLIYNQYMVFKNMHEFGKENAIYFHELPIIGSFYQHGVCHYNITFFKQLAEYNKYNIIYLYISNYMGFTNETITTAYQKTSLNPFMSLQDFKGLLGLQSTYSDWIILPISFIKNDIYNKPMKFEFIININEVTSIDGAKYYCETHQEILNTILQYNYHYEDCIKLVYYAIERHKIQNTIRS